MAKKTTKNPLAKKGLSTNTILTVGVLLVAALVIGGVLLFGGGSGQNVVPAEVLRKPDSHTLLEAPDNKVTLVEFLDFQCPSCASYYQNIIKKVEQDYAGRITFVPRNFPLPIHPLARLAAQAAEAAALQGKYREMYHALFDNYASWAYTPDGQTPRSDIQEAQRQFEGFARQIGLNLDRLRQDMQSDAVAKRIDADLADGNSAGVEGTPSFYINGKLFVAGSGKSSQEIEAELRAKLDEELSK